MNQYLSYVVLTTVQKSYFVYDEIIILGFSFESFNRNAVAFLVRCLLDTDMMECHCKNKILVSLPVSHFYTTALRTSHC